jgi:hypothetical protein
VAAAAARLAAATASNVLLRASSSSRLSAAIGSVRSMAHYSNALSGVNINILDGRVDKDAPDYKKNAEGMQKVVAQLRERVAAVRLGRSLLFAYSLQLLAAAHSSHTLIGGDEDSRKKHVQRKKLLVRDRIDALLDPGYAAFSLLPTFALLAAN